MNCTVQKLNKCWMNKIHYFVAMWRPMHILCVLVLLMYSSSHAQTRKRERVPSYFGFQFNTVFPTRFIGEPILEVEDQAFYTRLSQKTGFSFGGTVRAGVTQLIAIETGINFTQRNFDLYSEKKDSLVSISDELTFIEYSVPINALFYIRLADKWFMNASLGGMVTFKPTDIGVLNMPGGPHSFRHTGLVRRKLGFDVNANIGFEFRTEKSGFFYLGGSGRVPFVPLFDLICDYTYQGNNIRVIGEVDGSFLALDIKYFFPVKQKRGVQYNKGPIE